MYADTNANTDASTDADNQIHHTEYYILMTDTNTNNDY